MPGFRSILKRADAHFAGVAGKQPEALACRRGCSLCCHGLFEISAADISVLADGLASLPPAVREEILHRAEATVATLGHPVIQECTPEEKEAFFIRADDVPCPALAADGACLVYEHRPLVCRTFGLPLRDGSKFLGEECELNFLDSTPDQREEAAWNLQWEDVLGPEDQFTIPEALLLIERMRESQKAEGRRQK
ncbi:MAG: YkgJ family cysteine cluster protein [Acidobacteria bacterium]|nr:YkgJ family cysteine cluster protein [Acidobacteriota bacterium]